MINVNDFSKLDLRIGTILKAELLENAKTPAYVLEIDLSPKKIAGFTSDVLVLGANSKERAVVLLEPEKNIPNGAKVG